MRLSQNLPQVVRSLPQVWPFMLRSMQLMQSVEHASAFERQAKTTAQCSPSCAKQEPTELISRRTFDDCYH
jgi:hypothetical protein